MTHAEPDSRPLSPELLGAIYSAAISPHGWGEVLDRCATEVGALTASVMSADGLTPGHYSLTALSTRLAAAVSEEHLEHWISELAPLEAYGHEYLNRHPARQLYRDNEIWTDETALRQRADYRFLEEHVGVVRKLVVRLNDNPRWYDALGFHYSAELDDVPAGALAPARALVPHIGKAVELSAVYLELHRRHAAVLSALDHVAIGMVIIDERERVVVSNNEAQRILDDGQEIRCRSDGHLVCREPQADARLRAALAKATLARTGAGTLAETILALKHHDATDPVIVEVTPLQDGHRELINFRGGALVQMIDVGSHRACTVDRFAVAWLLTDAETSVAQLIIEGQTNREIADIRGVALDTVKSQVRVLMLKCRVGSRVELVRAVLKTVPPIT